MELPDTKTITYGRGFAICSLCNNIWEDKCRNGDCTADLKLLTKVAQYQDDPVKFNKTASVRFHALCNLLHKRTDAPALRRVLQEDPTCDVYGVYSEGGYKGDLLYTIRRCVSEKPLEIPDVWALHNERRFNVPCYLYNVLGRIIAKVEEKPTGVRFGFEDYRRLGFVRESADDETFVFTSHACAHTPGESVETSKAGTFLSEAEKIVGMPTGFVRDIREELFYVTQYITPYLKWSAYLLLLLMAIALYVDYYSELYTDAPCVLASCFWRFNDVRKGYDPRNACEKVRHHFPPDFAVDLLRWAQQIAGSTGRKTDVFTVLLQNYSIEWYVGTEQVYELLFLSATTIIAFKLAIVALASLYFICVLTPAVAKAVWTFMTTVTVHTPNSSLEQAREDIASAAARRQAEFAAKNAFKSTSPVVVDEEIRREAVTDKVPTPVVNDYVPKCQLSVHDKHGAHKGHATRFHEVLVTADHVHAIGLDGGFLSFPNADTCFPNLVPYPKDSKILVQGAHISTELLSIPDATVIEPPKNYFGRFSGLKLCPPLFAPAEIAQTAWITGITVNKQHTKGIAYHSTGTVARPVQKVIATSMLGVLSAYYSCPDQGGASGAGVYQRVNGQTCLVGMHIGSVRPSEKTGVTKTTNLFLDLYMLLSCAQMAETTIGKQLAEANYPRRTENPFQRKRAIDPESAKYNRLAAMYSELQARGFERFNPEDVADLTWGQRDDFRTAEYGGTNFFVNYKDGFYFTDREYEAAYGTKYDDYQDVDDGHGDAGDDERTYEDEKWKYATFDDFLGKRTECSGGEGEPIDYDRVRAYYKTFPDELIHGRSLEDYLDAYAERAALNVARWEVTVNSFGGLWEKVETMRESAELADSMAPEETDFGQAPSDRSSLGRTQTISPTASYSAAAADRQSAASQPSADPRVLELLGVLSARLSLLEQQAQSQSSTASRFRQEAAQPCEADSQRLLLELVSSCLEHLTVPTTQTSKKPTKTVECGTQVKPPHKVDSAIQVKPQQKTNGNQTPTLQHKTKETQTPAQRQATRSEQTPDARPTAAKKKEKEPATQDPAVAQAQTATSTESSGTDSPALTREATTSTQQPSAGKKKQIKRLQNMLKKLRTPKPATKPTKNGAGRGAGAGGRVSEKK